MCHTDLKKGGCGEGAPISHFIMAEQLVSFFPTEEPRSSHCHLLWEIAYECEECVSSAQKLQTFHDFLVALKDL